MLLEDPFAQAGLPFVEGQIPVAGLLEYRRIACDGRFRIYEVGGVERRAALLALVAVGVLVAAMGACAGHIAVGQKLVGLRIVELLRLLLDELTLLVEAAEEI